MIFHKSLIFLYCLHNLNAIVTGNIETIISKTNTKGEKDIAECVIALISKYFRNDKNPLENVIFVKISRADQVLQQAVLYYLHSIGQYRLVTKNSQRFVLHTNETLNDDYAQAYILVIRQPLDLVQDVYNMKAMPGWNPKATFFVVARHSVATKSNMIDVFNELRRYRVFDSFVIATDYARGEVTSYTWFPYMDKTCAKRCSVVKAVDKCSQGAVTEVMNYELKKKAEYLTGCPIKLGAIISEPYILPQLPNGGYDGVEINLLELMAQVTNTTLQIATLGNYRDGIVFDNIASLMNNEELDIVAGNIFSDVFTDPTLNVDALNYNFQERLVWCVPKAEKMTFLLNLLFVFEWSTWISVFFATLFMSALFDVHQRWLNKFAPIDVLLNFFVIGSVLMGYPSKIRPIATAMIIMLSSWFALSITTNAVFQSSSQSSLIDPRIEPEVATVEEVFANFEFGGHPFHIKRLDPQTKDEYYYRYRYIECKPLTTCMERVVEERDFAVVIPLRYMTYYERFYKGRMRSAVHCMRTDVVRTYSPSLMIWEFHPMFERFERIVKRVFESGLVFKWSSDILPRVNLKKLQHVPEPLKLGQLMGVFNFLLILLGASVVVFLGEVLYKCFVDKKRIK